MSAGNIKLNLKEFRHVSSDGKTTTLQHKGGHKLVLHHPSLSPESQEQLKALAKGGKAHYDEGGGVMDSIRRSGWAGDAAQEAQKIDDVKANPHTTTIQNTGTAGPSQQQAKGGKIRRYADGTDDVGESTMDKVKDFMSHTFQSAEEDQQKNQDPRARPIFNGAMEMPKKQPQQKADGGYIKEIHPNEDEPGYTEKMAEGGQPGATAYDLHLPCLNPNCKSHGRPHPNCRCYGMAKGGQVDNLRYCAHGMPHMAGCEYAKGGEVSQQGNDVRHAMRDKQRGNSGAAQQQMNFAKSEAKGRAEFERHVKPNIKGLKDGGVVQHFAEKGNVESEDAPDIPAMQDVERGFHHQYMEPDKEESQDDQNKGIDKEIEDASNYVDPQGQGDKPQAAAPMASEQQQQAPAPSSTIQPDQQAQSQPSPDQSQPQQPQQQDANTSPIQRFVNHKQMSQQNMMNEDQAWAQDLMNGHIKPETYQSLFAKKDTVGKLGTIFGLLLSGAGSGLSHQPNAVLAMMNQTIENDLKAQTQSKQNAENYLRLGQQHEMNQANIGNLNAETNTKNFALTQMKMNRAGLQTLVDNVNKMPDGPAKQAATMQLASLYKTVDATNSNIADRAATGMAYYKMLGMEPGQNEAQSNQSEAAFQQQQRNRTLLGPEGKAMADMAIDRHIPNLPPGVSGQASYPVPQGIKDQIHAQNVLDIKGKDLLSFVKQHSGTWNPQTIATAKQKIEEMKNFYNGSIEGGALTQGRLKWYDEQFKQNPTSIINQLVHGSSKRLEEVVNSNAMRRDQQLKDLGFTVKQPDQIKTDKNGVQWKRGPNGEAIRVK